MEFHDKLTIPNLGRMAVMDSVRKSEVDLLANEYAEKQVSLDLYYNRNMDAHIEQYFPSESLRSIPVTTLRILPKFARARMLHYKKAPYRLIGGESAQDYLDYTYHLDTQCRIASELAWTLGMIHMRSRWNQVKQRIEYDILPNVKEYFYEGESVPFGYSYEIDNDANGNKQYVFWSEDREEQGLHFIFTSDGKVKAVDGNPEMINIYKVNPISKIIFPYDASDVSRVSLQACIGFTQVMLAIRYQTGSPVISGIDQEIPDIPFGIDRLIALPSDSSFQYITPNTDINGMIAGIKELLTITAQNHNLAINFSQGTTPPSGIALKIMNLENEEAREADIPIISEFEQERYAVDRRLLEVHTNRSFSESYAVDFEESSVPQEWANERNKLEFMLENNQMTREELVRYFNPDITDEELADKMGTLEEEQPQAPTNPLLEALQRG